MDEFALISDLIAPLVRHAGARGLADDGALITPAAGMDLAVTKDMMVEGVHFLPGDPPDLVARKLMRTNLSDLAAMGARPLACLLGLASDGRRDETWYRGFLDGLALDQEAFGLWLAGGDTVSAPEGLLTLSLTAFGEVPPGRSPARTRARPGDVVAVSGTIGDAALGLLVRTGALGGLGNGAESELERRYLLPEPRTGLGTALLDLVHGAIDVSDGLVADAAHLARASDLAIDLDLAGIPLSRAVRRALDAEPARWDTVLTGGDDYELLLTMSPGDLDRARAVAAHHDVALTAIGRCRAGAGVVLFGENGPIRPPAGGGWRHAP